MKYCIILIAVVLSSGLVAQDIDGDVQFRNELSTDLSGAFTDNFRVDFNRRGPNDKAWVIGLRTRFESAGVTLDTSLSVRRDYRSLSVPQGYRTLDLSIGVKSYIGLHQPHRGVWFQLTALTSLVQWRSNALEEAKAISIYPDEYLEQKRMFGLEGSVGYRYLFDNGISLNAYISWSQLLLRSELISDRFIQVQRESGGFDGALTGSFLTLGYVW